MNPQLVPALYQNNPVHVPHPKYYFKIHFNIIFPPTRKSSKKSLNFKFPHQNRLNISLFPICGLCPKNFSILAYILRYYRRSSLGKRNYWIKDYSQPLKCLSSTLPTFCSCCYRLTEIGRLFLTALTEM